MSSFALWVCHIQMAWLMNHMFCGGPCLPFAFSSHVVLVSTDKAGFTLGLALLHEACGFLVAFLSFFSLMLLVFLLFGFVSLLWFCSCGLGVLIQSTGCCKNCLGALAINQRTCLGIIVVNQVPCLFDHCLWVWQMSHTGFQTVNLAFLLLFTVTILMWFGSLPKIMLKLLFPKLPTKKSLSCLNLLTQFSSSLCDHTALHWSCTGQNHVLKDDDGVLWLQAALDWVSLHLTVAVWLHFQEHSLSSFLSREPACERMLFSCWTHKGLDCLSTCRVCDLCHRFVAHVGHLVFVFHDWVSSMPFFGLPSLFNCSTGNSSFLTGRFCLSKSTAPHESCVHFACGQSSLFSHERCTCASSA